MDDFLLILQRRIFYGIFLEVGNVYLTFLSLIENESIIFLHLFRAKNISRFSINYA